MGNTADTSWFDPLTLWLALTVAALYIAEFFMGKPGRQWVRDRVESFWIKLQYVRWAKLGFEEARSFIYFLDKIFGARLMSWKRVLSCLVFSCITIILFYGLVKTSRYYYNLEWRPPLSTFHFATGFPLQALPLMIYISITRYFTVKSIEWFEAASYGTIKFLAFLVIFSIISYILVLSGVSTIFARSAMWLLLHPELVVEPPGLIEYFDIFTFKGFFYTLLEAIRINMLVIWDWFTGTNYADDRFAGFTALIYPETALSSATRIYLGPIGLVDYAAKMQRYNILVYYTSNGELKPRVFLEAYGMIATGFYTSFMDYLRFSIRILFAMIFVGSWIILRPLHWVVSLLLLRLAESDSGPLLVTAAAVAGFTKLVQVLFGS